jgi:NADH:ubiquinone oxidoreductase subunit 6 (subunit J)
MLLAELLVASFIFCALIFFLIVNKLLNLYEVLCYITALAGFTMIDV